MPRRPLTVTLACCALLVAACAPVPVRYALLQADGAAVVANKCWGTSETIRFEQEGVGVEVRQLKRGDDRWLLEMRFDIPAGKTVKLVGTDMRVFNRQRRDLFRTPFLGMSTDGDPAGPLAPIGPLAGGPASPLRYWIFAPVHESDVDGVLFALPPFTVDGAIVELPTVTNTHRADFLVASPPRC